jgi:hypothetical protein
MTFIDRFVIASINFRIFRFEKMAEDGVSCEPFSGLNSLLTGKITGKLSDIAQGSAGRSSMAQNTRNFLAMNLDF